MEWTEDTEDGDGAAAWEGGSIVLLEVGEKRRGGTSLVSVRVGVGAPWWEGAALTVRSSASSVPAAPNASETLPNHRNRAAHSRVSL